MKKKQLTALFLAFAMILALSACGKDKNNPDSSDNGGVSDSGSNVSNSGGLDIDSITSNVSVLDPGTAASLTSAQKDVINVGIPVDVANFNPWSFSGAGANQALMSLYQPLLHHEDGEYYSSIAKTNFVLAEDNLSCEFEIFDNIHDWAGNPLTVDDVIFSFQKCGEVRPQYAALIPEIEKTGDYTCTFHFSHPLTIADFDSFVRVFIVSEKAFNESSDGMSTSPVGTGPYKMTSYTSGYSMVYEKVEDFWQTDMDEICVRDLANVNTINFYVISENAQRTMALESGRIDICMSISAEDMDKFDGKNGFQLASIPSNDTMTLFCNSDTSSVCNDLNLRLAISYAVSGEAILQGVYNGNGVVCHELTPNYAAGYNPEWDNEDNFYNFDLEKAKEYLEQSNYNDETLVIICDAADSRTTAAQLVLSFLQQIGVKSKIASYEATVFEQYIQDPTKWDIMVSETQYNTYYVEGVYSNYDATRYASGGGISFAYDDKLQELIEACMNPSTYSAENLDLLHNHLIENCYVKGLATTVDRFVVPEDMTGMALNYRGFILPGACTYSD